MKARQLTTDELDEAAKDVFRAIMQAVDVHAALRQKTDAEIGDLLLKVWAEANLLTVQSDIISEAIDRLQRTNDHLSFNAQWIVTRDDETGAVYWSGAGVDDKDESRFNDGEPLICDPKQFEVGYTIHGYAPLETADEWQPYDDEADDE